MDWRRAEGVDLWILTLGVLTDFQWGLGLSLSGLGVKTQTPKIFLPRTALPLQYLEWGDWIGCVLQMWRCWLWKSCWYRTPRSKTLLVGGLKANKLGEMKGFSRWLTCAKGSNIHGIHTSRWNTFCAPKLGGNLAFGLIACWDLSLSLSLGNSILDWNGQKDVWKLSFCASSVLWNCCHRDGEGLLFWTSNVAPYF